MRLQLVKHHIHPSSGHRAFGAVCLYAMNRRVPCQWPPSGRYWPLACRAL